MTPSLLERPRSVLGPRLSSTTMVGAGPIVVGAAWFTVAASFQTAIATAVYSTIAFVAFLYLAILAAAVWRMATDIQKLEYRSAELQAGLAGLEKAPESTESPAPRGTVEIYLSFKHLQPIHLAELMAALERLYSSVYRALFTPYESSEEITDILRGRPEDMLLIDSVMTGESIKFRVKAGLWPSIANSENDDLVVELPKGVVAVGVVGFLLTGATLGIAKTAGEILRVVETRESIENLQLENQLKLREIARSCRILADTIDGPSDIDEEVETFRRLTLRDERISAIEVRPYM